jgi:hypothetical protein
VSLAWGKLNRADEGGRHDQHQPGQQRRMIADNGFDLPADGHFFDGQIDAQGDDDAPDHQGNQGEHDAAGGHVVPRKRGTMETTTPWKASTLISVGSRLDRRKQHRQQHQGQNGIDGWIILKTPG